ncbi:uncharacterized protein EI90DRAFT_3034124 [Cantharellus anzutake]|uniref:uncharacterized protein n=1 Tax=Cantharellus anzutake TaxID=1750568 RepID=UPI001904FD63|nr:uncharacterized protein EI90DRAFT_3034124 [Cantharellus anzutake]KAF8341497.1 hypothetical protein EI90DRAFT_3034124 [Cantharellus anzutake]
MTLSVLIAFFDPTRLIVLCVRLCGTPPPPAPTLPAPLKLSIDDVTPPPPPPPPPLMLLLLAKNFFIRLLSVDPLRAFPKLARSSKLPSLSFSLSRLLKREDRTPLPLPPPPPILEPPTIAFCEPDSAEDLDTIVDPPTSLMTPPPPN